MVDSSRPLMTRLKSWWQGEEAPVAASARPTVTTPGSDTQRNGHAVAVPVKQDKPLPDSILWSPARLEAVQQLWGRGQISPGGAERTAGMVQHLGLQPGQQVLHLGGGLGGLGRLLGQMYGVQTQSYELDIALAELGRRLTRDADLSEMVQVGLYNPKRPRLPGRYDLIVVTEHFYVVPKPALMDAFHETIQPRGHMIVSDFMLDFAAGAGPVYEAWQAGEDMPVEPWVLAEFLDAMHQRGFAVTAQTDMSDLFADTIRLGLSRLPGLVDRATDGALAEALSKEGDLWTRRMQVLKSGDLKLVSFKFEGPR